MNRPDVTALALELAPLYHKEGDHVELIRLAGERLAQRPTDSRDEAKFLVMRFVDALQTAVSPPPGPDFFLLYRAIGDQLGVADLFSDMENLLEESVDRLVRKLGVSREEARDALIAAACEDAQEDLS